MPAQVRAVEERINRRSRKVLGYRTHQEVFTAATLPPLSGYTLIPGTWRVLHFGVEVGVC